MSVLFGQSWWEPSDIGSFSKRVFISVTLFSELLDWRWSCARTRTWLRQLYIRAEKSVSSEPVISSGDNTSCVSMHEMACSSVHHRFVPDGDSVYLDKGAVSVHDNVVTDGISVWVTYDIRCSWYETRSPDHPDVAWRPSLSNSNTLFVAVLS